MTPPSSNHPSVQSNNPCQSVIQTTTPPGYKRTEIGSIPIDWQVREIGEIAEVKGGKRLPKGRSLVDKVTPHPYIRVSDMTPGGISLNDLRYVPEDVFPQIRNYTISSSDLFISVAGTLGIVGKVPQELDSANLTENADKITSITCDRDYLLHCLMSSRIQAIIEAERTLGAQPKLALTRIQRFPIPLPPLPEQRAIAEVLSDVDALIAALDRLIAKKRAVKQGAMQELLAGKTRLPGFSGEWTEAKLGDVLEVCHGKSQWGVVRVNGRYPILGSGGEIGRTDDYLYDRPSVLIGRKGTIDEPQYVESPFWTIDTLFYTNISDQAHAKYLYYLFCTIDWYAYSESSGRPSLNAGTIEAISVECPGLPEQRAIAAVLSDMDAEIDALIRRRDKTQALKQGMMQELLTGRTRLI